jgi:hypothetical protein
LDQFNMNDIRPFSLLSAEGDSFDPKLEDDTMISVSTSPCTPNLFIICVV